MDRLWTVATKKWLAKLLYCFLIGSKTYCVFNICLIVNKN